MGYLLYGSDMDDTTSPLECSLEKAVDLEKEDFIGKEAILKQKAEGIERRLVGFELLQKGIPRHGYRIYSNGKTLGVVTSGNFSPTLKKGIGLGFVLPKYSMPGTEILVDIRGKVAPAQVVEPPFYRKGRSKE
jgi:aminomethyltransferase